MSAIVHSTGRTGTNIVLEMLAGSPSLVPTNVIEMKRLFKDIKRWDDDMLTKCDIHYVDDISKQGEFLDVNPTAKIIWTIRDPRDLVMSKLYRGTDEENVAISADGSTRGCLRDLNHMHDCYMFLKDWHKDRVMVVKMEDVVSTPYTVCDLMAQFLDIKYSEKMIDYIPRVRKQKMAKEYPVLDKNQIGLYRHWEDYRDGYFVKWEMEEELLEMFRAVDYLIKEFEYDTNNR